MVRNDTRPTGIRNVSALNANSRSDPAPITGMSGRSSRKYLNERSASGHSWISSRKSSVPDDTFFPVSSSIDGMIFFGSGLAKHTEYFG